MVESSRHVPSAAPPEVVRVVTPRTTLITPPLSSTAVTPPRISRSRSLSLYRLASPASPASSAPPRGTAGSLSPAMAPATAAATASPSAAPPDWSTPPGATSTTRSQFSPAARWISSSTLSSAPPASTASRSRRASEACTTLSRSFFCTSASVLSHSTAVMFSSASRASSPAA